MSHEAPHIPELPAGRLTVERYFALVDEGVLQADDRVELLEGVVVAMSPQNPPHAASINRTEETLKRVLSGRACVRVQSPLVLRGHSVPEPDVAVVPGRSCDYDRAHPTTALLIVEVADSSLMQDRLTKTRIYAAAGVPEVWINNLRDDRVEVYREPDAKARVYRRTAGYERGEKIELVSFPDAAIEVSELLPARD